MSNKIEFIVLGDVKDLEKKLEGTKKSFDKLGRNSAIALAGLTASVVGLTEAAREQELAINQMNQALKNSGNFSDEASKDLIKHAESLQRVSLFGDETIIKAQALIASFGFESETVKKLTVATLDLAQAKGMDLASAADIVAKSVGSSTNALSRYGIEVEGSAGSTIRATSAIAEITKKYGGQARAATEGLGATVQLKNSLSDMAEDLGTALSPAVIKVSKDLSAFVDVVRQHPEVTKLAAEALVLSIQLTGLALAFSVLGKAGITLGITMAAIRTSFVTLAGLQFFGLNASVAVLATNVGILYPLVLAAGAALAGWKVGQLVREIWELNGALNTLNRETAAQEASLQASLAARGLTIEQVNEEAAARLAALQAQTEAEVIHEETLRQLKTDNLQFFNETEEQLKAIAAANDQAEIDALILKFEQERQAMLAHLATKGQLEIESAESIAAQKAAIEKNYAALILEAEKQKHEKMTVMEQKGLDLYKKVNADKLGSLSGTLQQAASMNKGFAIAYKVVAISEAIINTALGVTKALSKGNFITAGLIAAMGAIQIATIASQSFAVGTPSVPADMVAQIHKQEMIIPATFSNAIRRGDLSLSGPGKGGQGGGITIVNDFTGVTFNSITDDLVDKIFQKASENLANHTLAFGG